VTKVRIEQSVVTHSRRSFVVEVPADIDATDLELVKDWATTESADGGELTEGSLGDWWDDYDDDGGAPIYVTSLSVVVDDAT
jgi:hypothetical protein